MSRLQILSDPMKACIKGLFRQFGLEVKRIPPYKLYGWLRKCKIRTILDIGANVGQFAGQIHALLPDARLYSFEPLADCYRELVKKMEHVPEFHAFNLALGDKNGREHIFRNEYTPTSSLLPQDKLLVESFPYTASAAVQEIEIRRLDDVAHELVLVEPILTKIDVQGMEDKVLLGAESVIARTAILIVETSFEPLYKGQVLFPAIYDLLRSKGFSYMGTEHIIRNPVDGRPLQCDALFLREFKAVNSSSGADRETVCSESGQNLSV